MADGTAKKTAPKSSLINDPKFRSIMSQVLVLGFVAWGFFSLGHNAYSNLQAQSIATGFGFLKQTAGFGINFILVDYTPQSAYGQVFWVGLANTMLVALVGIFFATLLGFIMGVARLSKNWVIGRLATVYVELIRNLPLLLQIFFWYFAVLGALPSKITDHYNLFNLDLFYLGGRGFIIPRSVPGENFSLVVYALISALIAAYFIAKWAKKRQMATGQIFPTVWVNLGLITLVPFAVFTIIGAPIEFSVPAIGRFNFTGGVQIVPELLALCLALIIYTAAFIAEIVRAGILAVSHGQTEASYALGMRPDRTLKLVVVPQALRVIIPPLTSQYLNLTKNSSLAVAVGYPDLMSVFGGTTLNQTGQAIEVLAITAATYLLISLITSALMNIYNSRMALVER